MDLHSARLTGYTMPVLEGLSSPSEMLAHHARVSSIANQFNHRTGEKLIRSLINRKEWSPLEMVNLVFEIYTTRDISRQILRHRSLSFQEFSFRYSDATELGFSEREARGKHEKDRQKSVDFLTTDPRNVQWKKRQEEVIRVCKEAYEWALKERIAKECARAVLPEGITHTRLYANGTLRSWWHYCELRCDEKTQKEHRKIANCIIEIIYKLFPMMKDVSNSNPSV